MSSVHPQEDLGSPVLPAAPEPVHLLDLTDEELVGLDGPGDSVVVMPYWDTLPAAHRDVAVVTAYRGLVARGLVSAPDDEAARQAQRAAAATGQKRVELDVTMTEELSQVLSLRRLAGTVVCAQRTLADSQQWRYLHVLDEDLALEELVGPTGLHRFSLLRPQDVAAALLHWLIPTGCDDEDGPTQVLDPREAASGAADGDLLDLLPQAQVLGDVVVRRVGSSEPPALLGTFAAPGLLVLSRSRDGEPVRLSRVSRSSAFDELRGLLDQP